MRRTAETILSFGMNLVVERLRIDPRWKWVVIGLIVANEIRGLAVVGAIAWGFFR
jgi:hypothetical protein